MQYPVSVSLELCTEGAFRLLPFTSAVFGQTGFLAESTHFHHFQFFSDSQYLHPFYGDFSDIPTLQKPFLIIYSKTACFPFFKIQLCIYAQFTRNFRRKCRPFAQQLCRSKCQRPFFPAPPPRFRDIKGTVKHSLRSQCL